jgi:hypothetical protein
MSKVGVFSNIIFQVQNVGTANWEAKHSFGVTVYKGSTKVFEDSVITNDTCANITSIKPYAAGCEVRTGFIPKVSGTYTVVAYTTAGNAPELTENNNVLKAELKVNAKLSIPGSAIKVTAPTADEQIKLGDHYLLKWQIIDLQGLDNNEGKIDLYSSNGTFVRNINTLPALYKGAMYWDVKTDIPAGKYFIRIGVNDSVYGDSQIFTVVEDLPIVSTEDLVGYGYIKKFTDTDLAGGFAYYVESEYTPKISIGNCDKRYPYIDEFIATTEQAHIMARVYGTKSIGQVCVNKIAVVPDLGTKSDKYTGVVKSFTDGGYGGYAYYVETSDGAKIGITSCNKRALPVENLIAVAIKTGIQVDIIGYKINAEDKNICLQGLMTK